MPLDEDNSASVSLTCCILHNICTLSGEDIEFEADEGLENLQANHQTPLQDHDLQNHSEKMKRYILSTYLH